MKLGLLRNRTDKTQFWGSFELEPEAIACVPIEVVESLRQRPMIEFEVLNEQTDPPPFCRTDHWPFSPRYR